MHRTTVPTSTDRFAAQRTTLPRLDGGDLRAAPAGAIVNAFTVDVEDWPVAVLGPEHDITPRVVDNTRRLLDLMRWHNVRGTFFVLTRVADRFPELVREIDAGGHEVASHGHAHESLTRISPRHFEEDVLRSISILTEIIGKRPIGYRAPAFSIVRETRWAGPILAELGFVYSSSVFPIRHPRYGIPDAPLGIHRWPDCGLVECPPSALSVWGWNAPVAGGGYFRLMPGAVARAAITRVNRSGRPAIVYAHPYELDVAGVSHHKSRGVHVGFLRGQTQSLFRDRVEGRLHRLFESFRFTALRDLLPVDSIPA